MSIIKYYLFISVFIVFLTLKALASFTGTTLPIEITYQEPVTFNIASQAVNRISFDNFQVTKIIGQLSGFNNVLSDDGSSLFIAPKLPVGRSIMFSALLSSGDIIDFSLKIVKSKSPSLVKLKLSGSNIAALDKSEAVKMIEAMSSEINSNYYVQTTRNTISSHINISAKPSVKILIKDNYRFGNLRGYVLSIRNTHRKDACEITADDLAFSFSKVVAARIEQPLLLPGGKTKGYIVLQGEGQ